MQSEQDGVERAVERRGDLSGGQKRSAKFLHTSHFQQDLEAQVDRYFEVTGLARRDLPRMYIKTALILAWFGASYGFLVFAATSVLGLVLGAVSLGLAMAGIGFNIQHDANHGGYSEHRVVNQTLGWMLDVLGGSSYLWRWKHNIFHHSHPNVTPLDTDVESEPFIRMAPSQPRYRMHRWQHWYAWWLYGLLAVLWHFTSDFIDLINGSIKGRKVPRPSGKTLVAFIFGKVFFFSWTFGVPCLFHPLWQVAVAYGMTSVVLGFTLSVVFQLAHCVEDAEFPTVPEAGTFDCDWAVHQLRTTVDFARGNGWVTWYLGGLNYQVEHHLFPKVSHLHYPAIAAIVESTCRSHGVLYRTHARLSDALLSHARWLRKMGLPVAAAT